MLCSYTFESRYLPHMNHYSCSTPPKMQWFVGMRVRMLIVSFTFGGCELITHQKYKCNAIATVIFFHQQEWYQRIDREYRIRTAALMCTYVIVCVCVYTTIILLLTRLQFQQTYHVPWFSFAFVNSFPWIPFMHTCSTERWKDNMRMEWNSKGTTEWARLWQKNAMKSRKV